MQIRQNCFAIDCVYICISEFGKSRNISPTIEFTLPNFMRMCAPPFTPHCRITSSVCQNLDSTMKDWVKPLGNTNIVLCYKYCVKIIQNYDYSPHSFSAQIVHLTIVTDNLN